jgi:hypothetical protein
MQAADLIMLGRDKYLDDSSTTGYLWSDDELLADLNWAQKRAAEWGLLLRDSETAAICSIALVSGQAIYALDPRIITVESITLVAADGSETDVPAMARKDIVWTFGNDWRVASGQPKAYEPIKPHSIRTVAVPNATWAGKTLRLDVNRYPLADMTMIDEPEIPENQQEDLLYGMAFQAFLKRDADAEAIAESKNFFELFSEAFGPPQSHTDRMHRLKTGEQEQDAKRRGAVAPWKLEALLRDISKALPRSD